MFDLEKSIWNSLHRMDMSSSCSVVSVRTSDGTRTWLFGSGFSSGPSCSGYVKYVMMHDHSSIYQHPNRARLLVEGCWTLTGRTIGDL